MKISCPACAAKYSIADEKVQDRLAKIRCRKCGTTIVIDGKVSPANVYAADGSSPGQAAPPAGSSPSAGGSEYSVDFGDNDQRSMSLDALILAYNNGEVTAETYVWADGMGDWQPLGDVPEIVEALHAAAGSDPSAAAAGGAAAAGAMDAAAAAPDAGLAPAGMDAVAPGGMDAAALPAEQPAPDMAAAAAPAAQPSDDFAPAAGGSPWEAPQAEPQRAAAKPGGGRGSTADLFGNFDAAGSETDVVASSAPGDPGPAPAPTGARNESSVLFSLSALTAADSGGDAPKPTSSPSSSSSSGTSEDSGLIDLKALTASADDTSDNAMAGGVFGTPAPLGMAAPLGGSPLGGSLEATAAPVAAMPQQGGSSKTGLYIAIGLGVAGVAIALALILKPEPPPPAPQPTAVATTPAPVATPTATQELAAKPPATGTAEEDEEAPDAGAAEAKKEPTAAQKRAWAAAARAKKAAGGTAPASSPSPAPKPKPKSSTSGCNCPPGDLQCAMRCAAK